MTVKMKFIVGIFLCGVVLPMVAGIFVHYLFRPSTTREYTTLSEISRYAASLQEFPVADDTDWEDPHYLNYLKSRLPSAFATARQWFGLWQTPPFSVRYLGQLWREITKSHHQRGLVDGGSTFIHLKAIKPTKIIIFGDVHGAFHSLVRDLEDLRAKNILTDDLILRDANTYIVFNGDFIDRSPYSVDTLILGCLLMQKNPNQVFYVAGKHERSGHWLDYGLRRELYLRGRIYSTQQIPFLREALAFFESLPEAIYVSGMQDQSEVIRISFNDSERLAYNEHLLHPSFVKEKKPFTIVNYTSRSEEEEHLDVRAVVKTEDWRQESRIAHGLGLLDQHAGATSWAVLSSPVAVNRAFLGFYDDAYATVTVDQAVKDAYIELTYQDSRLRDGFKAQPALNMISARPHTKADNANYIRVASTMSLIRGLPNVGLRLKSGLDVLVNDFNRTKGPKESIVRLYVDNDDNVPSLARHNVTEHVHMGTRFFLLPLGTSTTLSYLDVVEKSNAAVFFPASGATSLRSKDFKHVVHFRATFVDEARALARELVKEYSALKIAIMYRDDEFGRPPFEAAVAEFKKLGITEITGLPYTRGSTSFKTQASKLKHNLPDALGLFTNAAAAKELLQLIGINELVSPKLFALSIAGESHLRNFLKRKGLSVLYGSPVPNPKTSTLPIAVAYREAMDKAHTSYDPFSFEGYIGASLFFRTIEAVKNDTPTTHQILHQFESMKNHDFYGLRLNFNPVTRSLATQVWLEDGEDKDWAESKIAY